MILVNIITFYLTEIKTAMKYSKMLTADVSLLDLGFTLRFAVVQR